MPLKQLLLAFMCVELLCRVLFSFTSTVATLILTLSIVILRKFEVHPQEKPG
jgi:hypothetical protein